MGAPRLLLMEALSELLLGVSRELVAVAPGKFLGGPRREFPGGTPRVLLGIDREFVTSAKKFANFNEFSEIKKIVNIRTKIR